MQPDKSNCPPGVGLATVLRQLCPRCGAGKVFTGMFRMHESCPVCALPFRREPGYFLGAMYFSYALGGVVLAAIILLLWLTVLADWQLHWIVLPALVLFLPFLPLVFRYSRVLWMHFDRFFDP